MSLLSLKNAMVALFNADSAIQAITGRSTANLIARRAPMMPDMCPVVTFFVIAAPKAFGTAGHRNTLIQIETWVDIESTTAISDMETLMDRAEVLLTGPQLTAQGVDASIIQQDRADGAFDEKIRSMRADFQIDLTTS